MKGVPGCIIFFGLIAIGMVLACGLLQREISNTANAQANLEYSRGHAQAMVITAQSESRLSAAQAGAITSASLLPWGVLGILGLLGMSVVALCVVVVTRPVRSFPATSYNLPAHTVLYLPAPGQPRHEVWQSISATKPSLLLREHTKK